MENKNTNNFKGDMTFNGPTQIVAGNMNNNTSEKVEKEATYLPEPVWRSPFTMGVLTWIGFGIALVELFPITKIIKGVMKTFNGSLLPSDINFYMIISVVLFMLLLISISFRGITKNQTRHPLMFNYAISGYGGRLTIEKLEIGKCPQCGGNMRYYNKPIEWVDHYIDGKIKREVTKKTPALECRRNAEHWFRVDPAEDMLN